MKFLKRAYVPLLVAAAASPALAASAALWAEQSAKAPVAELPNLRALASQVLPCVVSIQTEQQAAGVEQAPLFDDFFRGELPPGQGIGSGFAIRGDGLILTNQHVVENSSSISITFVHDDGTQWSAQARVVGMSREYDVALLQVEGSKKVPFCYLGDSDDAKIGDWVMAVGNPFGLSHSVSVGIISARERRDIAPSGRHGLYNFLQTDASINPGNSGGPLINMRGEVVGINSAVNAAGSGIGFAIPINMVKTLLPSLKEEGKFTRSWIGIKVQPVSASLAKTYGLEGPTGALVSEVVPKSPAEAGGLREGDVVLEFNGKRVRDQSDLPLFASMAGVGQTVTLRLWRDAKPIERRITLTAFPTDEVQVAAAEPKDEAGGGALGIVFGDITPELAQRYELKARKGVILKDVRPGSPAARAGLRPGDLLLTLNGEAITEAGAFSAAVRKLPKGAVLRLQVKRPGGKLYIALEKP